MVLIQKVNISFLKNSFEYEAWSNDRLVCGIDEVGRGCLAGPVVSAAVIIPAHKKMPLLKDSKLLTPQEREKAYKWIKKHCLIGVSVVSHRVINCQNIRNATLISMKKALLNLLTISPFRPSAVLVDAMPLSLVDTNYDDIPVYFFDKGESKSTSIAAASIVAKVMRDALMKKFDDCFPGYGFSKHKGYGTPVHRSALLKNGSLIVHRTLFIRSVLYKDAHEKQLSLC